MSLSKYIGDIPNEYYAYGANGAEKAATVSIGSSCAIIGTRAFQGNNDFYTDTGLIGDLVIPDSVTSIGGYAFKSCYGINSLTLGENVAFIGSQAFENCYGLTGNLIIPENVTTIEGRAFAACENLNVLYIACPAGAWTVDDNLVGTLGLTNIYVRPIFLSGYDGPWRTDQSVSGSVVISEWEEYHTQPIITQIEDITFEKEETISLQVVAVDPEGGGLTYSATGLPDGLSINSATGLISGTIGPAEEYRSPFLINVSVKDQGVPRRSSTTTFAMYGPSITNTAPTITELIPDQIGFVADVISLQVEATDPDAPLTYSATGLPDGISIDPVTGLISGTISLGAEIPSPHVIIVNVTDSGSPLIRSNEMVFIWNVYPEFISENTYFYDNYLKSPPELFQKFGPILANEYEDNEDIYSITFGTSCTSIGDYAFSRCTRLGAGGGSFTYQVIEIGENVESIGSKAFYYCSSLAKVVIPNSVTSIGSRAFHYTRMGSQGSCMFIDTPASSWTQEGFQLFGSPTLYVRDIYRHTYDAIWKAAQGYNEAFNLGILNWNNYPNPIINTAGNEFPDIEQLPTQLSLEEDVISLQVVATDPDNEFEPTDILTYSATNLPAGLSIDSATGLISGTISLGAEISSPHEVLISVSDDGDPIATKNMLFIWNVTGENTAAIITTIPDQDNEELDVISLQVNATDPQGHNLTYSAIGLPNGISIDSATGLISGTIEVGTEAFGPFRTIVTVTDDGNPIESSEEAFNWYVPTRPTQTTAYNYITDEVIAVTATDIPNSWANSIGAYQVGRVEIGTSCTSIGGSSLSFCYNLTAPLVIPKSVTSIGSYAFSYNGSNSIEEYYVDVPVGAWSQASFPQTFVFSTNSSKVMHVSPEHFAGYSEGWKTLHRFFGQIVNWDSYPKPIRNINQPPVIAPISDKTNYEVDDYISFSIPATDPEGLSMTYSVTGRPAGLIFNSGTGQIYGNINEGAASGSPYTVTVTATDSGVPPEQSLPVQFTWTVEVPNQAPVLDPISTQNSNELDVISLQVTHTDLENNNMTYSATGLPTGLSINTSTGLISGTISSGAEVSSPYVAYITITDDGAPSKSDSATVIWTVGSVVTEGLNKYYDASDDLINAFNGDIPASNSGDPNVISGDLSLTRVEIGTTCTDIELKAFLDCSNLTSLTIGSNVENIGSEAFRNCLDLNSEIIIGDGVENSITTIGSYAFYNCGSLTGPVVIGSSVTSIGDWAFAYDNAPSKQLKINELYVDVSSDIWGQYTFAGFFASSYGSMVIYVSPTYFGIGTNYDANWRSANKVNVGVQIVNWDNYPAATPNP